MTKWLWKMHYCFKLGLSPADFWDEAEDAYINRMGDIK